MEPLYLLRRDTIEVGSFTVSQITQMKRHGVLRDSDHISPEFGQCWLPLPIWLRSLQAKSADSKRCSKSGKTVFMVGMIAFVLFLAGMARAETDTDFDHHMAAVHAPQAAQVEPFTRHFSLVVGIVAVGVFFQQAIFRSRRKRPSTSHTPQLDASPQLTGMHDQALFRETATSF